MRTTSDGNMPKKFTTKTWSKFEAPNCKALGRIGAKPAKAGMPYESSDDDLQVDFTEGLEDTFTENKSPFKSTDTQEVAKRLISAFEEATSPVRSSASPSDFSPSAFHSPSSSSVSSNSHLCSPSSVDEEEIEEKHEEDWVDRPRKQRKSKESPESKEDRRRRHDEAREREQRERRRSGLWMKQPTRNGASLVEGWRRSNISG